MAGFSRAVAAAHLGGRRLTEAIGAGLEAVAAYGGTGGSIALGLDGTWAAGYSTPAMARGVSDPTGRRVVVLD
jgi:hypothetical protein